MTAGNPLEALAWINGRQLNIKSSLKNYDFWGIFLHFTKIPALIIAKKNKLSLEQRIGCGKICTFCHKYASINMLS